jgi:hypothetical protein
MDFQFRSPGGARRHYVDQADVEIVLGRLPPDVTARIRRIHFTDDARGNRVLGYVTRGRREIALNALPLHVSLNQFIGGTQSAPMFGAVKGAQWPPLAVRRFMLYDVLLHEIGHLQVIHEKARTVRRKFGEEIAAQDFANRWREDLWSKPFGHTDPVHDPPSGEEIAALRRKRHARCRCSIALWRRGRTRDGPTTISHEPLRPSPARRRGRFITPNTRERSSRTTKTAPSCWRVCSSRYARTRWRMSSEKSCRHESSIEGRAPSSSSGEPYRPAAAEVIGVDL